MLRCVIVFVFWYWNRNGNADYQATKSFIFSFSLNPNCTANAFRVRAISAEFGLQSFSMFAPLWVSCLLFTGHSKKGNTYLSTCYFSLSFQSGMNRIIFKAGGLGSHSGNWSLGVIPLLGECCAVSYVSVCHKAQQKWKHLPLNLPSFFFLLNPKWTKSG